MKMKIFKNGLVLLYTKNKTAHNDAFHINVLTGSALETKNEYGINHLVEHLMFKASKKRTTKEISEQLECTGAVVNAWTNYDSVRFHFNCLPSKLAKCAEIYADMLFNKNISQEEFYKEKQVVCQEIAMYQDLYAEMNSTNYFDYFWNMKDVAGTQKSVTKITLAQVNEFINKRYVPANMVISVYSKLSYRKIKHIVKEYFGNQENPAEYINLRSEWKRIKAFKYKHVNKKHVVKKDIAQVQVIHSFNLEKRSPALLTFYRLLLSAGLSAILFREVREKHGLCYSIQVDTPTFIPAVFNGKDKKDTLMVVSSLEADRLDEYMKVVPETIKNLEKLLTKEDIERAVNFCETSGFSINQIASDMIFRYNNPQLFLGKDIFKEFKYIKKHAKMFAEKGMKDLKESKFEVCILGNTDK